jgi:asparagine synthetase B (glutamine-hydrolysing)
MPRFFLGITSRPGEASVLPKLRPQQTASLVFDLPVAGRRCVLYRVAHRAGPGVRPALAGETGPVAPDPRTITIRLGDNADAVVTLAQDKLSVTAPLACVRQVYHRRDAEAWWFSDDPRLLIRPGMSLDVRWLLCQLELGAHPGPYTPWREIRRIPLGMSLTVDVASLAAQEAPTPLLEDAGGASPAGAASDEARIDAVAELLDDAMRRACPRRRGVVLFSGGVDSGLIAARAAEMGWKEFVLAHSSRGPRDLETENARQMAAVLKLQFRAFEYRPEDAMTHLSEMFDAYTTVNDFSMMPTWTLARQILEAFPEEDVVLDGTGADGVFGGLEKWKQARLLYRVPAVARKTAGWVYRAGRLWARPGRAENVLRIVRRCALWPFPAFRVVLNPLGEIAYHAPRGVRREVAQALLDWLDRVAAGSPPAARPKFVALVSGTWRSSEKAAAALDNAGVRQSFPFQDPKLLAFAFREVTTWPTHLREGKGSLKQLLTRSVPAALVYRPKSGLSVLPVPTFGQPSFLRAFAEVLETSAGPFEGLIDRRFVRGLLEALERRQELAWFTYEFVWALVFGHHWITRIQQHATAA